MKRFVLNFLPWSGVQCFVRRRNDSGKYVCTRKYQDRTVRVLYGFASLRPSSFLLCFFFSFFFFCRALTDIAALAW